MRPRPPASGRSAHGMGRSGSRDASSGRWGSASPPARMQSHRSSPLPSGMARQVRHTFWPTRTTLPGPRRPHRRRGPSDRDPRGRRTAPPHGGCASTRLLAGLEGVRCHTDELHRQLVVDHAASVARTGGHEPAEVVAPGVQGADLGDLVIAHVPIAPPGGRRTRNRDATRTGRSARNRPVLGATPVLVTPTPPAAPATARPRSARPARPRARARARRSRSRPRAWRGRARTACSAARCSSTGRGRSRSRTRSPCRSPPCRGTDRRACRG